MASPFNGSWRLYGTENAHMFAESFHLPAHIASSMVHLRPREEIHVNGDQVHLRVDIPSFEIPGHTVEKNVEFGKSVKAPQVTTGSMATGTLSKVSDTLWVSNLTSDDTGGAMTITREIVGNEMWVSIEARGQKMVHKYERTRAVKCPVTGMFPMGAGAPESATCAAPCPATSPSCPEKCPEMASCSSSPCSPFVGSWTMYGTEGSDQFYAAANVPEPIRNLMAHLRIYETIHVNGEHVHIRICVSPVCVPARVHETSYTFNKEHRYVSPFTGDTGKGIVKKDSDAKWSGTVTGMKSGDITVLRELVNGEMWITFATPKGNVIRNFERYEREDHGHDGHGHSHEHQGGHHAHH